MIDPANQQVTGNVVATFFEGNRLSELWARVIEQFDNQPEDKQSSFSFHFKGERIRVRENARHGLTVMIGR